MIYSTWNYTSDRLVIRPLLKKKSSTIPSLRGRSIAAFRTCPALKSALVPLLRVPVHKVFCRHDHSNDKH